MGKDISCRKYRPADILGCDIIDIYKMSSAIGERSVSCGNVFSRKAFKIDIRNIESVCGINDEIRIFCVF